MKQVEADPRKTVPERAFEAYRKATGCEKPLDKPCIACATSLLNIVTKMFEHGVHITSVEAIGNLVEALVDFSEEFDRVVATDAPATDLADSVEKISDCVDGLGLRVVCIPDITHGGVDTVQ